MLSYFFKMLLSIIKYATKHIERGEGVEGRLLITIRRTKDSPSKLNILFLEPFWNISKSHLNQSFSKYSLRQRICITQENLQKSIHLGKRFLYGRAHKIDFLKLRQKSLRHILPRHRHRPNLFWAFFSENLGRRPLLRSLDSIHCGASFLFLVTEHRFHGSCGTFAPLWNTIALVLHYLTEKYKIYQVPLKFNAI